MNRRRWAAFAVVAAFGAPGVVASVMTSCAQNPNLSPLRSFESAKDIDVVCLQVSTLTTDGGVGGVPVIPPIPVNQDLCAPVPFNLIGADLPYHLFALVTQYTRGEVAVVDLTSGVIIDEDPATPGVDFLVVGANPAGIAAAPNGAMTFVTSADPNKPALYGLPSLRMLGAAVVTDSGVTTVFGGADAEAPTLPDWPACSLPQTPGPVIAIPQNPLPPGAINRGPSSQGYILAVVLPGDSTINQAARVVTIDPTPLLRGGGVDIGPGPVIAPGSLAPCPILGEIPLSGLPGGSLPPPAIGPPWDDGVKYVVQGGPPVGSPQAAAAGYEGPYPPRLPSFVCVDGGAEEDAADGGSSPPKLPLPPPQASAAARHGEYLYVGDHALPLIHVLHVDVSNPEAPLEELAPLLATSISQPGRTISVSALAVSPATRDYKTYLYAVDQTDDPASIIVYDITDPVNSSHLPLTRPHSELTPQLPLDRIQFNAPVAAIAFGSHDFPLTQNSATGGNIVGAAASGLLCNPNPIEDGGVGIVETDGEVVDFAFPDGGEGALYRNNFQVEQISLGPGRLRGIFGFATLTNGAVMLIDVDDWDSPCRRPEAMTPENVTSDIAPPEIATPLSELEKGGDASLLPYQVPEAGITNGVFWVTNETFFPVSQPHRPRSFFPLDNDPVLGIHYPQVLIAPQLVDLVNGAILAPGADAGDPIILPTSNALDGGGQLADPSGYDGGTGVRLAWEDPLVHLNQNWTITYEGVLPTFSTGVEVNVSTNPADDNSYQTLVLSLQGGQFCEKGVEDAFVGRERVAAVMPPPAGVVFPSGSALQSDMAEWVGDYIQITDSLLPESDVYWSEPDVYKVSPVTPSASNKGNLVFTVSGTPAAVVGALTVSITTAGAEGTAKFSWTLGALGATGVTTSTANMLAGTGLTLNFTTGSGVVGDSYTAQSYGVTWGEIGPDPKFRYESCADYYQPPLSEQQSSNPPLTLSRDFPIYEAFDDHFIITRFRYPVDNVVKGTDYPVPEATTNRYIEPPDPSNVPFLQAMKRCFHSQIGFAVRAGGEWVAAGSVSSLLHHVTTDAANRCVLSCNPQEVLLNSRSLGFFSENGFAPDRNSPLAMRNSMFAYYIEHPLGPLWTLSPNNPNYTTSCPVLSQLCGVQRVPRDLSWEFTTENQFTNQLVNLAAGGGALSPQSMLFIPSLGQVAIVDGAQAGLILINLNTIQVQGTPFF
jgi:hypothetical protein